MPHSNPGLLSPGDSKHNWMQNAEGPDVKGLSPEMMERIEKLPDNHYGRILTNIDVLGNGPSERNIFAGDGNPRGTGGPLTSRQGELSSSFPRPTAEQRKGR